jgi:hypothetical protein
MRRRPTVKYPLLIAAIAVVCACASAGPAAPTASAGVGASFFGLDFRPNDLSLLSIPGEAGAGVVRRPFDWYAIEFEPGQYRFWYYDAYVGGMARQGIDVLPILFDTPGFYSSAPRGVGRRGFYPPRNYAALGNFGAALVRRYGPGGSFWAENPDIPPHPIRAWQIWNEPNIKIYWPRGPNARQYVRLLRAATRGIKRVDRGAKIVTAGLPQSRLGIPMLQYMRQMYKAGGRTAFDIMAINPYGPTPGKVLFRIRETRRVMNARGDRGAPIWITEVGWASDGPPSPFSVGRDRQASQLAGLWRTLALRQGALNLRGVIYYNWIDTPPTPTYDFWGLHTGLIATDGYRKPAFWAFKDTSAALR